MRPTQPTTPLAFHCTDLPAAAVWRRGHRGSPAMIRPIRRARPLCRSCFRRSALAQVGKGWRVVKHHDLCRQCWRSLMDAFAAWRAA
jgi:hypothetical protein